MFSGIYNLCPPEENPFPPLPFYNYWTVLLLTRHPRCTSGAADSRVPWRPRTVAAAAVVVIWSNWQWSVQMTDDVLVSSGAVASALKSHLSCTSTGPSSCPFRTVAAPPCTTWHQPSSASHVPFDLHRLSNCPASPTSDPVSVAAP